MVITLTSVPGIPMVRPGDDLAALLVAACERNALAPADGDILVVAQKIVSKAEGRYVDLAKVRPSEHAVALAAEVNKDPRLVEVILAESRRVVRKKAGVLIVEHRLGFIMANAGVDRSNIDPGVAADPVLLLPSDPDASAAGLHQRLTAQFRKRLGVIITDTAGKIDRASVFGDATLGANFSTGAITGAFSNMVSTNSAAVRAPWNDVSVSASIVRSDKISSLSPHPGTRSRCPTRQKIGLCHSLSATSTTTILTSYRVD